MVERLTQLALRNRAERPPLSTEYAISTRTCDALLERARSTRSRYPPTLPSPTLDSLQPLSAGQRARIGVQTLLARNAALRQAHGVVIGRANELPFEDTLVDALLPAVARRARDSHSELTAQLKRQHRTVGTGSATRDAERWLAYTRDLSEHADRVLNDERDAEAQASEPSAPQRDFASDVMAQTGELMALYERVLGPTLALHAGDHNAESE